MEQIKVIQTASRGIAVAPAYCYHQPDLTAAADRAEGCKAEAEKFHQARKAVIQELEQLSREEEIFAAHREIANDFMLLDGVLTKISVGKKNAQQALSETIQEFETIFSGMNDAYMKERAADIRDVGKRLMANLKGIQLQDLYDMSQESIVVAKDLYPSDTVKMKPNLVKGILTEEGGITSHISIMAKSMGIPILVGVQGILEKVMDGVRICMDAENGDIVIDPDAAAETEYLQRKQAYEREQEQLLQLRGIGPVTKDGKQILLCANVGNLEDIQKALPMNIDGVGLFRTEFLYMENSHFPTEEEQFEVYSQAASLVPQELTIRTLDIGGDKALPYFEFEQEDNPFLGWRAIRISLKMRQMFKEQLRAILRASAFGHVRIMFPMVISMEELREAKGLVEECKKELLTERKVFDDQIETGIMIETPASVLMADEFAKESDFFSIGTNDLTQYLLAVDRGNKKISDLYDFMNPAVLRAIRHVIEAGHRENIKVGMCGEMAGSPKAIALLLNMGLDEFSMSAGSIDYARKIILDNFS